MSSTIKTGVDRLAVGVTKVVIRHRIVVILAVLLGIAGLVTQAQHLTFGNSYRVFFSDENPELITYETFQETYTKNDNVFIFVKPRDDGDVFREEVMRAVAALTEGGWQIPYSLRVDSVTNFQYTYAEGDDLIVEDLIEDPARLSPDAFAEKRALALGEPLLNGQLVSPDGRAVAVNVVIQYPEESESEVFEVATAARALRDRVAADYPGVDIRLTGVGMLNFSFTESGMADYSGLIPIMFATVLALVLVTVRSASAAAAVMVLVILSMAVSIGAAGILRVPLTPISLSSIIVVLTLAVADAIHILLTMRGKMRDGADKRAALIEAMRVNYLAIFITSLTTIVGFLALNASDAPPFWHLGNMAAAGIAAAWFLSITLLPAMMSFLPFRPAVRSGGDLVGRVMTGFANLVIARKAVFAGLSLAISIGLISQIPRIEFNDRWVEYFDERIAFRTASDASAEFFGLYPVEFSVPSGEAGGISEPAFLERLEAFSAWLRSQENVRHVYSLSDIMKRLNKNLNADDPAYYRLPDDRELAAQYLLLYELSLPYGLDLNDRINLDKSATRVTATLGNVTTAETKAFLAATLSYIDETFPDDLEPVPTSTQVMFTFITDRNVEQMISGTILAIVLISLVMVLALRSVKLGLLSLLPNAIPILISFGVWSILIGQVGFSIAVVAATSLGIVVDDTVHLMTKYLRARREQGLSPEDAVHYSFVSVGPAILVNTVILVIGFSLLTLSSFKPTVDMGILTGTSILAAAVFDFLFLPALLIWTDRDPTPQPAGDTHADALTA